MCWPASFAPTASRVPGRFFLGGGMVDHVELAHVPGAGHDLVKGLIVLNGVHVQPVHFRIGHTHVVDVEQLWIHQDVTIIVFGLVEILDKVVPEAPLPDDVDLIRPDGFNFYDLLVVQEILDQLIRVSPGLYGVLPIPLFDQQALSK